MDEGMLGMTFHVATFDDKWQDTRHDHLNHYGQLHRQSLGTLAPFYEKISIVKTEITTDLVITYLHIVHILIT